MLLGVNIDHIAVLREARQVNSPNLIQALQVVEVAGGDQITIHLREDRRHIVDRDLNEILHHSTLPVNLEMSLNSDIVEIALQQRPHRITVVPESRDEVTTEGGLDVRGQKDRLEEVIALMREAEIEVSLFIDPDRDSIEIAHEIGADMVELHTGTFANIYAMLYSNLGSSHHSIEELQLSRGELKNSLNLSLELLQSSAKLAKDLGMGVAGGHGLNYQNIALLKSIKEIEEVNIGQSIVARSVFTGLHKAITDMRKLLRK